ncbi:hypothetical protein swp_4350 [Shewanella piezotolerans WP3]|uniref:DoxX n=1 Tax=Shewanella piezotolerans (strain WP3 / JCM 13877) TaxID=225849 RepID=B8CT88_SHEPW|nr:DoxX family protein [Shewanella piezotolerans]ACJ30997.1 hypothetical protein swp_4350 [Shewanella piezotolerans WP3]
MKEIIIAVLVTFFMFASSIKLLGWQKLIFETQLKFFKKYGLNRQVMFVVGLIELSGAILLSVFLAIATPIWTLWLGAVLIVVTSLGAIFFHLRFDRWQDGIPAMVTLLLSLTVLLS